MPKTIFVIDDNGSNLTLAEEALEDDYRVITFSASTKMFAVLEKVTPDLILLDIEMPEMDGFETIKHLKENTANAVIPVVFLTATDDSTIREKGKGLGAVDFVIKPFTKSVLLETVKKYVG
jgi:putative two-component system response regulator